MKKLLQIIKDAADGIFTTLRETAPADFELQVEAGTIDLPVHEANDMRRKLARIADVLGGQMDGRDGAAWRNVAFNLNPANGRTQRVSRSFNR